MRRAVSLCSSFALVVLSACGGAQSTDGSVDPLAIVKPTQEDHVVVGVPAQGRPRILRGPNALEVKHGPEYDSWPRPFIEALRAVVAAEADWSVVRRAIDREIDREGTRLTLELIEDGRVVRTVVRPVRLENLAPRVLEPPPLDVRLEPTADGLQLVLETGGAPWFAENGCDTPWSWAWPLDEGALPADAERVVLRVAEAWREQRDGLYARVAVEGDVPVRAGVVVRMLARLAALGMPCFDLDLMGGPRGGSRLGGVELALHWLTRQRTGDGLWARDPTPGTQPSVRATSLALAAFVGAGYTFRGRHPFARVIAQALEGLEDGPESEPGTYAIVAAVLTHLHATAEAESLYAPTARALAALPDRWRNEVGSPLASGFAAVALASRRESSPPVDAAFRGELLDACRLLAEVRDDLALAVGAAGCVLLGDDLQGAPWRAPFQALLDRLAAAEAADPVTLLFATIAAFRVGSDASPSWLTRRARAGKFGQNAGPMSCGGGAWDPVPGSDLGRVETTALRALDLEIVYRYDRAFGAPTR